MKVVLDEIEYSQLLHEITQLKKKIEELEIEIKMINEARTSKFKLPKSWIEEREDTFERRRT